MLTVAEISEITGFKVRTITEWIKQKYLSSVRGPSKHRPRHYIRKEEIIKFMKSMKMGDDIIKKLREAK